MTLRRRLIEGAALNLIAVAFNQGSTLVVNILVARILLQQSFGEYSMVMTTLLTMAALSQGATGYTVSKYVAEFRTSDPGRAGRIMGLCAVASVIMASLGVVLIIAIAPWLAGTVLDAPHLGFALILGAAFLFFTSVNGFQTGALSGLEAFATLARAGVASGLAAVVIIVLGARWAGLNGALVGLSASAAVRCGIHYIYLQRESVRHGIQPKYSGALAQERTVLVQFALPAAIAGYFSLPMIWLASAFLARQPNGYGQLALFAAANNFRILVLFLPGVMNSVGLSVLNNEKSKTSLGSYEQLYRSNVLQIFLVSAGGAIVLGILGRPILGLFGGGFEDGLVLLWLLLISSVLEGTSIGLYQYIQSKAQIWLSLAYINLPRELLLVVSAYWLVQTSAGVGLAAAYLLSTTVGLVMTGVIVVKLRRVA